MSEKELLCVALVTENGERYNAEIYQDGTYLARDGSYLRLTELEFEHAKVLTRRAERERGSYRLQKKSFRIVRVIYRRRNISKISHLTVKKTTCFRKNGLCRKIWSSRIKSLMHWHR